MQAVGSTDLLTRKYYRIGKYTGVRRKTDMPSGLRMRSSEALRGAGNRRWRPDTRLLH
jgi:hypothetical protein